MFLDIQAEYTSVENSQKDRTLAENTNVVIALTELDLSYTTVVKKKHSSAPDALKRAMFRSSSRAITKILS